MKHIILSFVALLLIGSCQSTTVELPHQYAESATPINIFPDYSDVTIPVNIAPLNFEISDECDDAIVEIVGGNETWVFNADKTRKLTFEADIWRNMLNQNKGKALQVVVYTCRDEAWTKHPAFNITVAHDSIDKYLSYRLIEPSYELYRQLGIYQRDMENFDERAVYENNRSYDADNNHCVNCHNYQNFSADRMLFHVRAKHGGTVFIEGGKAQKLNMKCDSILSNTVYPAWHPTEKWVVFSSNKTGQAFHMLNKQKVEVIDYGSDLVFFDVENKQLSNILKTTSTMETFPCWHPNGDKIYYCAATLPVLSERPDSTHSDLVLSRYDSLHYNVMSCTFDRQTMTFGSPQMVLNCDSLQKSATVPRVSPDGRYLLVTLGDYGQFHIWHHSADLYVVDLQTGELIALEAANSERAESYHTWSSNGRWIVFASRRDDSSYSRIYIAYFSKEGKAHKAFLLPQADPEHNFLRLKSYNVPELTRNAVAISAEELQKVIYDDQQTMGVGYKSTKQE